MVDDIKLPDVMLMVRALEHTQEAARPVALEMIERCIQRYADAAVLTQADLAQKGEGRCMTTAATYLLRRMQQDGRLAYLIGPGSQAYELLTQEAAQAAGQDPGSFRAALETKLRPTPWPSEGDILDRINAAVEAAKKEVAHG